MGKQLIRSVSNYNNELKLRGFNVFQIEGEGLATKIYSRKDFNNAYERLLKGDVKYRFVIDMASLKNRKG